MDTIQNIGSFERKARFVLGLIILLLGFLFAGAWQWIFIILGILIILTATIKY